MKETAKNQNPNPGQPILRACPELCPLFWSFCAHSVCKAGASAGASLNDNENDSYIDPPTEVLDKADELRYKDGKETAESISAAENYIEEIANADPEPDWLHDGNEYDGEMDI